MSSLRLTAISRPAAIAVLAAMLSLVGCSRSVKQPQPGDVTVEQLHQMVQNGQRVFLLDVRTAQEFAADRLPFANLRIPFDSLAQNRDRLPDTSVTIYAFCRTGRRSGIAVKRLTKLGYHHLVNVEGGITAWKKAGYPTVSEAPAQ